MMLSDMMSDVVVLTGKADDIGQFSYKPIDFVCVRGSTVSIIIRMFCA